VQIADATGRVAFTSIFPACYSGRWPHIHFEVYPDQASITDAANAIATSQVALPKDVCELVYAQPGYEASVANLEDVNLVNDNVFGDDGAASQTGTVTGDVTSGYMVSLAVGVDTTTASTGGLPVGDGAPSGVPGGPGGPPPNSARPSGPHRRADAPRSALTHPVRAVAHAGVLTHLPGRVRGSGPGCDGAKRVWRAGPAVALRPHCRTRSALTRTPRCCRTCRAGCAGRARGATALEVCDPAP
jgi:hypothetical protein